MIIHLTCFCVLRLQTSISTRSFRFDGHPSLRCHISMANGIFLISCPRLPVVWTYLLGSWRSSHFCALDVWGDVLHHICVCTKFWFSPWHSNKVLLLQPLSLAAPPVSASLLLKDRIPVESAQAAAHLLCIRQALHYLPGYSEQPGSGPGLNFLTWPEPGKNLYPSCGS